MLQISLSAFPRGERPERVSNSTNKEQSQCSSALSGGLTEEDLNTLHRETKSWVLNFYFPDVHLSKVDDDAAKG